MVKDMAFAGVSAPEENLKWGERKLRKQFCTLVASSLSLSFLPSLTSSQKAVDVGHLFLVAQLAIVPVLKGEQVAPGDRWQVMVVMVGGWVMGAASSNVASSSIRRGSDDFNRVAGDGC